MAQIELSANRENLEKMLDFIVDEAQAADFPAVRIWKVRLAAEEVLVNVFSYAYPEKPGHVVISCLYQGGAFSLKIVDSGIPFNILKSPDPDVSSVLSERQLGGLGIYFVKQMADEVRYVRKEGRNQLTLLFRKNCQKFS